MMIINNKAFEEFTILERLYTPLSYSNNYDWLTLTNTALIYEGAEDMGGLRLKLYIREEDLERQHVLISNLKKELRVATILFDDDDMEYVGTLESFDIDPILRSAKIININLKAYSRGHLQELNVTNGAKILITGNMNTDAIFEFTGATGTVRINDIEIKNCIASETIVIDGVAKKITSNGKNKFKDSNLYRFPRLNVDIENTINIEPVNLIIKVKYYPRYY